jgi:WhiB family transcriptional regulator, redox-sensing transcriptional regulator
MESDGRPGGRTTLPGPVGARPTPAAAHLLSAFPLRIDETPLGACTKDPDRWAVTADVGAKELCRACPRRWLCAQEACETPGAEGVWAGILIPKTGRARQFALRQLRSLAERNGSSAREVG